MPPSDVDVGQDLSPHRLVFPLGVGECLDLAGIATVKVVAITAREVEIAIEKPKSLRASPRRKRRGGQPDILPLPAARKTA
jgi:hypothetical protein